MQDTSIEIKEKYRKMLLEKTGLERIMMGVNMTEAAKVMALSSMSREDSESDKRINLFLRFYFNDFSKDEREKIIRHLKQNK